MFLGRKDIVCCLLFELQKTSVLLYRVPRSKAGCLWSKEPSCCQELPSDGQEAERHSDSSEGATGTHHQLAPSALDRQIALHRLCFMSEKSKSTAHRRDSRGSEQSLLIPAPGMLTTGGLKERKLCAGELWDSYESQCDCVISKNSE